MRSLPSVLMLIALGHPSFAADDKPLKVFLLAGQSNMVGKRSTPEELPEKLRQAQSNALVFTGTEWVPVKPGTTETKGFGPELSFCERMTASLGEPIGIVKVSVGGTNLAVAWSPERPQSLYGKLKKRTDAARKSRPVEVVGFVWMQGGADAKSMNSARAYHENLRHFIETARRDFGDPNLLFVCGRSAAPPSKYPHIADVRKAQEGIDLSGYAWVDCDAIPVGGDGVHFSTQGQVQSGQQFADAMLELLGAKKKDER